MALSPAVGEVEVLGQQILGLTARQRRQVQRQIGTVHQQHQLVDNLSVIHNVNAGHLGRWPFWKALWSLVWPQEVAIAQQALDRLDEERGELDEPDLHRVLAWAAAHAPEALVPRFRAVGAKAS